MIDPQAEAIKRLMQLAKSGAQRTPLVPRVTADPVTPPVGLLWIREDEQRAYLKVDDTTTLMVASAEPGPGGEIIAPRSLPGDSLMLNTITSDEIGEFAVGTAELMFQAVTGDKWAPTITAESSLFLDVQNPATPGLHVDVPFDHATDIARFEFNGTPRFRLTPTELSIGTDLPGSAVSIQTNSTDVALRVRGSGGPILLESQAGLRLLSVDGSGNLVVNGSISSLSGNSGTAGSLAVQGALTVTDQANFLSGLQVAERVDFLAELEVDGQSTFNGEVFLPANYSAKVGQAVHLRTIAAEENRLILEGVSAIGSAEIQLGTDGPVLRGSSAQDDRLFIGDSRIVTSAASGIFGNQIATDTLTGGAGPGVGNLAAETIYGYNIKNGSITSTELSPGAVVAGAIAAGAVGSVELADGSVIDRVVASLGVGKLVSGTLNADEVFMGPSGHIYLGPTFASEINDERIQIDSSGIRSYNEFGTILAEFTPGGFALRTSADASRLEFDAVNGLELYGSTGERTGYLSPLGEFQLDSIIDGARMSLNSQEGVQFYAGATKNLAYNPGFIGSSEHELPVAGEASNDQRHVFAGEWAVRFRATNPNINAPSYVDVPFKNTVGTGSTVTPTRVNWCTNPSAHTQPTGWNGGSAGGTTASSALALGFFNDWAINTVATVAGPGLILPPLVTVVAGQQWAFSALVRVSTGMSVTAEALYYDVNNVLLATMAAEPVVLQRGVVTQVGVVSVAPPAATTARLRITASLAITDKLEVGNALYERASGIGDFFDGNSDGYQWDGAEGISTSSLIPVAVPDSPDNLLSIFVWSDVPAWAQIEGRDSTANLSRGLSAATQLIPNQWSRISVQCTGVMDKVRLHYPSTDPSRQTRIVETPVWWSGLQVEADKAIATPFCSGNEPGCRWEGLEGKSPSVRDRDVVVTQISPTLGTTVSGAIVGGSLTSASFFAGRIFGTEITGGRITGNIITGNQINGDQILAGTIQGTSISARTIDAASIKVGTLTGTEILANSINGDRITAGTIQATQIGANQVTADKMQANMILSQRIIVGTSAGARVEMHPSLGLQAYATNGTTRTFWINAANGSITAIGTWRTGEDGERIEILTDGTQRFYQNTSSYASILNEASGLVLHGVRTTTSSNSGYVYVANTNASITYGRATGTQHASFRVDQAGVQSWGRLIGMRFMKNMPGDGTDPRIFIVGTNSSGGDQPGVTVHLDERGGSSNSLDIGWPAHGVTMHGYNGVLEVVQNGNRYAFAPVSASNVVAPSSETLKEQVAEIAFPSGRSSWDVIEGAPSQDWYYTFEGQPRPPKPLGADGQPIPTRRLRAGVDPDASLPDAEKFEWVEMEWPTDAPPPTPRKKHRFPLAEDLYAIDPELVAMGTPDSPEEMRTDLRDLIGILWDAVDMLIKRNRLVEEKLAQRLPAMQLPARPQKGDVVAGVGSVIAGRTQRDIDLVTGQIRNRIRDILDDLSIRSNNPRNP